MMTWLIALGGTLVLALVIAGLLATWYKKVETRGQWQDKSDCQLDRWYCLPHHQHP